MTFLLIFYFESKCWLRYSISRENELSLSLDFSKLSLKIFNPVFIYLFFRRRAWFVCVCVGGEGG